MPSVIGAQMFTIRDFCKTPTDLAASCKKLRGIGYECVQVSGIGPHDVKELAKTLAGEGLRCVATHKGLDEMKNTQAILDYHAALGCKYTAIGGYGFKEAPLADWKKFAADYSVVAKTLAAKGLLAGYHNHSHEFARIDGQLLIDLLIKTCDKAVWFELDTYWVQHGGGDPAAWIDRVAGRIPCVHFKDMAVNTKREHQMLEIGAGNLNWPRILDACKRAGVEYYLVERDRGDLDPFESLKISLHNMKAMGLN